MNFNRIKCFYEDNSKLIKTVAVVLTLLLAVFLFLNYGKKQDNVIITDDSKVAGKSINTKSENNHNSEEYVFVDIIGEVKKPGVFKMKADSRVFQVIDKAGGLLESADVSNINKAEKVVDGQRIVIGKIGETSHSEPGEGVADGNSVSADGSGKININMADKNTLQKVRGIGPAMAGKIVDYRRENGKFNSIEDLKNISGIGEKIFENLKDQLTV